VQIPATLIISPLYWATVYAGHCGELGLVLIGTYFVIMLVFGADKKPPDMAKAYWYPDLGHGGWKAPDAQIEMEF